MDFYGTSVAAPLPPEEPRLLFFDRKRGLADRETLTLDDRAEDPVLSPEFQSALQTAAQVYIVDGYFAETRELAEEILWVATVADVKQMRIITARKAEFWALQDLADRWKREAQRSGTIELRTLPKRADGSALPHDRFALLDGTLWHWGATVGGGFSGLNACSFGWSAKRTGAAVWFKELWERTE